MAAGGEGCPAFGSGCEPELLAGPWGSPGPVLAWSPIGMAGGTTGHRKTMLLLGNVDLLPVVLRGCLTPRGLKLFPQLSRFGLLGCNLLPRQVLLGAMPLCGHCWG